MVKKNKPNVALFRAGLKTPFPEDFIKECKKVVNKILPGKNLGFNRIKGPSNNEIWELSSNNVSHAEAKYSYTVIPFLTSETGLYWITVTIEFEYEKGTAYLMDVSIIVFKGRFTDDNKTALLRAEWDCFRKIPPPPHAQPHWHVYQSQFQTPIPSFIYPQEPDEFVPEDEKKDEPIQDDLELPQEGWTRGEKFHFAMSARWHTNGEDAHQENLQHEWLLNWLNGCIKYIIIQMKSMYGEAIEAK